MHAVVGPRTHCARPPSPSGLRRRRAHRIGIRLGRRSRLLARRRARVLCCALLPLSTDPHRARPAIALPGGALARSTADRLDRVGVAGTVQRRPPPSQGPGPNGHLPGGRGDGAGRRRRAAARFGGHEVRPGPRVVCDQPARACARVRAARASASPPPRTAGLPAGVDHGWRSFPDQPSARASIQLGGAVSLPVGPRHADPGERFRAARMAAAAGQFLAVLALADLTQYWIHRCFHRLPFLWRLHSVHHSSMAMDWLAGSRMHPLDALATRAGVMTVVVLAGASLSAVALYLAFVSFHAVFIHANFGAGLEWLDPCLVTPRYHHFHHATEAEAIDKNFAVHLPVLDRMFGTQFLTESRAPRAHGVSDGPAARTYLAQILDPFRR